MTSLETKIPPPVLTMVICVTMGALSWLTQGGPATDSLHCAIAVVFMVCSGLLGAPAFFAFARAKTTINPVIVDRASALVTTGIYRYTRNPMYVALTLMITSAATALGGRMYFIGPVLFVLYITRFQIIPEERALRAKFGEEYDNYCSRVRRWI